MTQPSLYSGFNPIPQEYKPLQNIDHDQLYQNGNIQQLPNANDYVLTNYHNQLGAGVPLNASQANAWSIKSAESRMIKRANRLRAITNPLEYEKGSYGKELAITREAKLTYDKIYKELLNSGMPPHICDQQASKIADDFYGVMMSAMEQSYPITSESAIAHTNSYNTGSGIGNMALRQAVGLR